MTNKLVDALPRIDDYSSMPFDQAITAHGAATSKAWEAIARRAVEALEVTYAERPAHNACQDAKRALDEIGELPPVSGGEERK